MDGMLIKLLGKSLPGVRLTLEQGQQRNHTHCNIVKITSFTRLLVTGMHYAPFHNSTKTYLIIPSSVQLYASNFLVLKKCRNKYLPV